MTDHRQQLLDRVDAERHTLVHLLSGFVRVRTPNPPGDTREGAAYLARFLAERGLASRMIAPKEHMPNLVASFEGGSPGRHLVLNGHIDVFPASEPSHWTHDPWSGAVTEGRIWGGGTVDMKCGIAASVLT